MVYASVPDISYDGFEACAELVLACYKIYGNDDCNLSIQVIQTVGTCWHAL
jgi:hypothetical protein